MSSISVYVATAGSPTHVPAPTFTDVTSSLLAEGGVTFSQGVSGAGTQQWAAGSFLFTLKNTSGTYSGPALLRRPVKFVVTVGASTVTLRGVITDITEYREGVRRLQVSGTDMIGMIGDLEIGSTWDEQLTAQSVSARWPFTDSGADVWGTYPLSTDPLALPASGGDLSGQDPVFGVIDGCPALSGGGVTLEPVATTGYLGVAGSVPAATSWTWTGWVRIVDVSLGAYGCLLSVVATDNTKFGFCYTPGRRPATVDNAGTITDTAANTIPLGQWLWWQIVIDTSTFTLYVYDATGTQVSTATGTAPSKTWNQIVLGGHTASVGSSGYMGASVQIADATWQAAATSSPTLLHGHVGYRGETTSDRLKRVLKEAALIPASPDDAWNGTAPAAGPALDDEPLTRRPLADVVQVAMDSSGYVLHDLPQGTAANTSLALMAPDIVDGYGASATTYAGGRVLLASDGVTTNTGMLVNAATVIGEGGQITYQIAYEDATSVSTYGKRAVQVTSWAQSSDYRASLASWLARRAADPANARSLPDIVLDADGMVADGATATLVAMAKTGACITITGLLPGGSDYSGVVRGVQWDWTPQGAVRVTLRCQAARPLVYAVLGTDATVTLDSVVVGW